MTPLTSAILPAGRHGFFTREGGVSEGPYASLNCSLSGADRREAVLENRARAARALGAEPGQLAGLTQIHGIEVAHATKAWPPGAGPRADAIVTDRPGIALGIVTADCAPVLFADQSAGVAGAAHAGWRGAVGGILEATVAAMLRLGATRQGIAAAVGPCIGQGSYEVGPDLRDAVLGQNLGDEAFFRAALRPGHWQFDLAGYCAARLPPLAWATWKALASTPWRTKPGSSAIAAAPLLAAARSGTRYPSSPFECPTSSSSSSCCC